MAIEITMPALSPTMEKGTLAKWLVKEGDTIESGDVIAEIETDKATMEVEAVDEGTVAKIYIEEGAEDVAVGTLIAMLAEEDEDVASVAAGGAAVPAPAPAVEIAPIQEEVFVVPAGPVAVAVADDPEIPEGTAMVSQTVRESLRDAMAEEMRKDPDVFVMGEEVAEYQGAYKVTQGLLDEFGPERVIDTPITEHGFAGLGAGAAFAGLKPVIEFMTFNFAMQAIDHIINSAAKTRYMSGGVVECPIVFRGPNGAASRVGAQHSQNYAAWYANVPGLKVIAPYDARDNKALLKAAIQDPNPVVFLENELMYGETFDVPDLPDYTAPIGKARIFTEGTDVTIVSYSITVGEAIKAAEMLAEEGISAEVIDLRTIRPLDLDTLIESVKKTNRCVVAEEGWPQCSVASDVSAQLMEQAFDYLDAPVTRVNSVDVPLPYANNLEKAAVVSAGDIVKAAKAVCYAD
ncbi:pyruvate dehydrogenase complex E1 component subunit beta [Kordiimonas sp. SCSIO 12603]|uniref:pyruvate dehydrogenase complex E1 component subunit beta n=1 Tax=Kordiimonas sp. SCSIO 12603 TaxID=2829596 RepID=UPI002107F034|nr:pyruvate dehydrogenase complex E1 component subunit beta [Kordiimonas sp. SCSIO 12603]UTW57456.1 pyruvate dehydrogenase complex E1 component subunit beta [Kordiimonas sp. SCSIO 12603]